MTAAAFDTLTTARKLEAAGIERRQAESIAEGMRRAIREADLAELRAATRADLYRALWIQGAAFVLIVLIVAAGTGVIVLRAIAPSPDTALQAHPAAERRTPAVAALQAHPGTASSRAATDPAWWGSAATCTASYPLDYRHSFLAGRCIRWTTDTATAPETDRGGQAKTL